MPTLSLPTHNLLTSLLFCKGIRVPVVQQTRILIPVVGNCIFYCYDESKLHGPLRDSKHSVKGIMMRILELEFKAGTTFNFALNVNIIGELIRLTVLK